MRVAVTGARGFIGSHIVRFFTAASFQVVALGRHPGSGELQTFAPESGEYLYPSARSLASQLEGVDVIVHLAGRSSADRSIGARLGRDGTSALSDYLEANVVLTEQLLKVALQVNAGKFIYASSRMIYPSWISEPRHESMQWRPDSAYGLSKSIAEDLVRMYCDDDQLTGVSLRLSQVIGEGDGNRGVLPRFIDSVRSGLPPTVFGAGKAVRDFVDVRDVVRAFALSVSTKFVSQEINIGGDRGYSVREMAEAVATEGGLDPSEISFVPAEKEDCSNYTLDCSRASQVLGWSPEWTLGKTIRERLR